MIPRRVYLLLFLLFSSNAVAETVLVRSGQSEGQGWAFRSDGTCWVATPRHVVPTDGVLISGSDGLEAESVTVRRSAELDLAILNVVGSYEDVCRSYGSPLGDRNTAPTLRRLINEGRSISLERRTGVADGGAFGLEILSVQVDALSEMDPIFTARTVRSVDQIYQSDSGSPIRLRGDAVGEAGLPLGLLQSVFEEGTQQFLTVLRMDVVRNFFEDGAVEGNADSRFAITDFEIEKFMGFTPDTGCGPLNIVRKNTPCGWNVQRGDTAERISLELVLGEERELSGVSIKINGQSRLSGYSVSTASLGKEYGVDRYCPISRFQKETTCNLAPRSASYVKITFEGDHMELLDIQLR